MTFQKISTLFREIIKYDASIESRLCLGELKKVTLYIMAANQVVVFEENETSE